MPLLLYHQCEKTSITVQYEGVHTVSQWDRRLTSRWGETTAAVCPCNPGLRTQRHAGRKEYADYTADLGSPAESSVPFQNAAIYSPRGYRRSALSDGFTVFSLQKVY